MKERRTTSRRFVPCAILALALASVVSGSVQRADARQRRALEWPGRFKLLVLRLRDNSAIRRLEALEKLSEYPLKRIEDHLLGLLMDSNLKVRYKAAEILVAKKSKLVVGPLIGWLNDFETEVRVKAVQLLGETRSRRAFLPLVRALRDIEPKVRIVALGALGRLKAYRALTAILGRLDDEDVKVRAAAVAVLAKIPHPRTVISLLGKLNDAAKEVRKQVILTLAKLGNKRAAPALLRSLKDPAQAVREAAVEALGHIHTRETVAALVQILEGNHPLSMRRLAASSLGRTGTVTCAKALVRALSNPNLRSAARVNLQILGAKAVPFMVARLRNPQVRTAEATELTGLLKEAADSRASRVLIAELKRDRVPLAKVVEAIGRCGDKRALVPILRLLPKAAGDLRIKAIAAVERLADQRAILPLMKLLKHPEPRLRQRVTRLLGWLKARAAVPQIRKFLKSGSSQLRLTAIRALGLIGDPVVMSDLLKLLRSNNPPERGAVSDALGRLADRNMAERMMTAAEEGTTLSPPVQSAYVYTIGAILRRHPDARILTRLARLAKKSALAHLALPAIDALAAARHSSAFGHLKAVALRGPLANRVKATEYLGNFRNARARAALIKILNSSRSAALSAAAVWALGRLGDKKALARLLKEIPTARHPVLRINLAAAMASLAGPKNRQVLLSMLKDASHYVRLNAMTALARTAGPKPDPRDLENWVRAAMAPGFNIHLVRSTLRNLVKLKAPTALIARIRKTAQMIATTGTTRMRWEALHPRTYSDWIAINIATAGKRAMRHHAYVLIMADGVAKGGYSDENGVVRVERIPVGPTFMEFPSRWPR